MTDSTQMASNNSNKSFSELVRKYTLPGPRYTSYPSILHWDSSAFSQTRWIKSLCEQLGKPGHQSISLYIHLPFCEQLCTFCGCVKRITKRHSVEAPYIDALLTEWQTYLALIKAELGHLPFEVNELHLGGGTPTFFSATQLQRLIEGLLAPVRLSAQFEGSVEGHPNYTSELQLTTLYQLGFRRISFGVQDYDPAVQQIINRIQPFSNVQKAHTMAREIGYSSISHDLVYGLPKQRLESILDTITKTLELQPDRLSFYSYAHVPWIKGVGQRRYGEKDLPPSELKRRFYEAGKKRLITNGYSEIGMDHFALPSDSLYQAAAAGRLHRNFMGYTHNNTPITIGLGASAISDNGVAYAQNEKEPRLYQAKLKDNTVGNQSSLPLHRGHFICAADQFIKTHILNIMCRGKTQWRKPIPDYFAKGLQRLKPFLTDQLVTLENDETMDYLRLTERGKPFIRNICMALDSYLHKPSDPESSILHFNSGVTTQFSQTL